MTKIFTDTNLLVYLHDLKESSKQTIASRLVYEQRLFASTQVLAEYINVCKRKLKMSKLDIINDVENLFKFIEVAQTSKEDFTTAHKLIARYDFAYFDSLIVATALNQGCTKLYSEDLQHGQIIENKLAIVNPFL